LERGGRCETEFGRFPRLQILAPADLFHGAGAKLPPLAPINRRHARVETRASHRGGAQGSLPQKDPFLHVLFLFHTRK